MRVPARLLLLIVILFGALPIVLKPSQAYAARPLVDSVSTGPIGNNTITWKHTVKDNTNGLLDVYIENNGTAASEATYNGIPMIHHTVDRGGSVGIDQFMLYKPPTGTHDIVVKGTGLLMAGAVSLKDVDQTNSFNMTATNINNCTFNDGFCIPGYSPGKSTELWLQLTAMENTDSLTFTPMSTATKLLMLHTGSQYFAVEAFPGVDGQIVPTWTISPDPVTNLGSSFTHEIGFELATDSAQTLEPTTASISAKSQPTYVQRGGNFLALLAALFLAIFVVAVIPLSFAPGWRGM